MESQKPRATRKSLLTEEQREYLRTHRVRCHDVALKCYSHSLQHDHEGQKQQHRLLLQVMSNPQLHQLAAQIKVLNRIRDQSKSLHKQQSMQLRPTPWSINLTQDLIHGQGKVQPYIAGKARKKAARTLKTGQAAKRPRYAPYQHTTNFVCNMLVYER